MLNRAHTVGHSSPSNFIFNEKELNNTVNDNKHF